MEVYRLIRVSESSQNFLDELLGLYLENTIAEKEEVDPDRFNSEVDKIMTAAKQLKLPNYSELLKKSAHARD